MARQFINGTRGRLVAMRSFVGRCAICDHNRMLYPDRNGDEICLDCMTAT